MKTEMIKTMSDWLNSCLILNILMYLNVKIIKIFSFVLLTYFLRLPLLYCISLANFMPSFSDLILDS